MLDSQQSASTQTNINFQEFRDVTTQIAQEPGEGLSGVPTRYDEV